MVTIHPKYKGNLMIDMKFMEAFEKYFKGCREVYNTYHEANGFSNENLNEYEYSVGKRYIKVIYKYAKSQRSVHSFVDMKHGNTYGDVLKPASWSAPAKRARSNIFNEFNGLDGMTPHGPRYLR